jgi:hypothetical protein
MPTTLHPPRTPVPRRELVLPLLAVAYAAIEPWRLRARLPDPVAIHWGIDGLPDGSAPLVVDALVMLVATALVALVPLLAAGGADRRDARVLVAVGQSMGAFFLLLRHRTLALNLDVTVWTEAGALTLMDLGVLALLVLPTAAFGWWVAGARPERVRKVRAPAQVTLPSDADLAWVGHQSWPVGRMLGLMLGAGGAVLVAVRVTPEGLIIGATLAFTGLLVWWSTSITVAVGPAGLRVRFGPLGWPGVRVPLGSITGVVLEDVEPLSYGGWGYRILPGVRAVIIRRGEGLRVGRAERPALVVTVDDAATAAAVLAAHVAARGSDDGSAH